MEKMMFLAQSKTKYFVTKNSRVSFKLQNWNHDTIEKILKASQSFAGKVS